MTDIEAPGVKELAAKDKITFEGDETEKIITIWVTAKRNYDGKAYGTYKVLKASGEAVDLSKAKIVAKEKNANGKDVKVAKQEYTGYAIEPEIRVMVKSGGAWIDVDPSKYEVSYINNIRKGRATILVTGNETEAAGSKTANFNIINMKMSLFKILAGK